MGRNPLHWPCSSSRIMYQMKHLLTAIACCLAVAGSAQSDAYPFNPDSDGDGIVGVADLLALLSDFGLEAVVETCFKGDLCEFWWSTSNQYAPPGCGTLIGHTYNANGWGINNIYISNEGYSIGDVVHLLHSSHGDGSVKFYRTTNEGESWSNFITLSAYGGQWTGRAIFNGSHWEVLD